MSNQEASVINDVSIITPQIHDNSEDKLHQKEIFRTKRSYIPVELDKRQKLIQAVEEEGLTIKEAAQNLKINYSTAKHIVKVFKRTGEVQTQMMTKRLPERDIQQLEYLAYKPQSGLQAFSGHQPLDLSSSQALLRHSYPIVGNAQEIQNSQNPKTP